jgi:hypothetical protein
MNKQFTHRGYAVKSTLPQAQARRILDDCLDNNYEIVEELKNNRHNYVARVNTGTLPDLVLKEPRRRNARLWERITTLFRPGEAIRVQDSHVKLRELGFACPEPILAAESRTLGCVTHSFFLYRYQSGRPVTAADAPAVAHELQRLHRKGYTRGDPKAQNFLLDHGQVYFIDFKLAKPRIFSRHSTRMEYAHFLHTMPEGMEYLPEEELNSVGFRFAVCLRRLVSDLKRKKRQWRE